MQLLAEAPAIGVDARYGVVAEVKLVQRGKAIERATVHFCQAVIFQVPGEKNQKGLTDKKHWSNDERISKNNCDFSHSYTLFYIPMWTHACVGICCQRKDRNSRTTQRKCPEGGVTVERSSTASKLGLKHPIQVGIYRVSVVWQQHLETCCLYHLRPRKYTWKPSVLGASGISLQWLINLFSGMERKHHQEWPTWFLGIPRGGIILSATQSFHVSVKTRYLKTNWDQCWMFKLSNFQRDNVTV